ncbi:MAG: hypothetical protein WA092_01295 [Minisyncoccales bacterium]
MKKDDFNLSLRDFARTLSPRDYERDLIGKIYQSFNDLFGKNNCIQIGSYPRFTSITPVHDLDVLYILGDWSEKEHDPSNTLILLKNKIASDYDNPTAYRIEVSLQTHSVTISYLDGDDEIISVDIVPGYIFSKNEFGQDVYKVPEILMEKHGKDLIEYYRKIQQEHEEIKWISSDPRGYIKIASEIDELTSGEFRKTVKIVKTWKNNLKEANENLKLKSFHLEQVIVALFKNNNRLEIFDAIFEFFINLPEIINNPNNIADRANADKFIDDYLFDFTDDQKQKIRFARDGLLIKLEKYKASENIGTVFEVDFYQRKDLEEFIFDKGVKTLIDPNLKFKIDGHVLPLPQYSSGSIRNTPQFQKGITSGRGKSRKITYRVIENNSGASEYYWKVKNSDNSQAPRGEITINQTKNSPESTAFPSDSYVECYAVDDGVCVARNRLNVKIID